MMTALFKPVPNLNTSETVVTRIVSSVVVADVVLSCISNWGQRNMYCRSLGVPKSCSNGDQDNL